MSFFTITCPWCQTSYTFGIVGRTQIGTGHRCMVYKECEAEDCTEKGNVFSAPVGEDARSADVSFRCFAHLEGRGVLMVQT